MDSAGHSKDPLDLSGHLVDRDPALQADILGTAVGTGDIVGLAGSPGAVGIQDMDDSHRGSFHVAGMALEADDILGGPDNLYFDLGDDNPGVAVGNPADHSGDRQAYFVALVH